MGRYSRDDEYSENDYSEHGAKDRMMYKLGEMMRGADSEYSVSLKSVCTD